MEEYLLPHGLTALFLLSFLAATVLPLGSEWFLVLLIVKKFDPVQTVTIASVGNYLGACTTYLLGRWGADFFRDKILRIDQADMKRAQTIYKRYGIWSLLLAWLPVVGDPLCFFAGMLGSPPVLSSVLVIVGKTIRYSFLAYLTIASTT